MTPLEIASPTAASSYTNSNSSEDSLSPSPSSPAPTTTARSAASKNDAIPVDADSAVPTATPVERGRFVLDVHGQDNNNTGTKGGNPGRNYNTNCPGNKNNKPGSTSPFHDANDSFDLDDLEQPQSLMIDEERILDEDLDRLLGPLPSLRNNSHSGNSNNINSSDDDGDNKGSRRKKKANCSCCPNVIRRGPWQALLSLADSSSSNGGDSAPPIRMGNMIVVFPQCYRRLSLGIVGPHWFGPVCCLGLLTGATAYYAPLAHQGIGPISSAICLIFYIVGAVSLFIVSCSDPGIVKSIRGGGMDGRGGMDGVGVGRNGYAGVSTMEGGGVGRDWSNWRYCDLCSVYQPPNAVHCPECNVCIEGYDHHCPWMGTCIGKKNFTSFVVFNMTWLFYLFYSIVWVTFVGPEIFDVKHNKP